MQSYAEQVRCYEKKIVLMVQLHSIELKSLSYELKFNFKIV